MGKIVLFGEGNYAAEAYYYFTNDSDHTVVAFTADKEYIKSEKFYDLPVVPFEQVVKTYPPEEYGMFVAVGYQNLNRLRAEKCREAKEKGYKLVNYISTKASNIGKVEIGENCLILENSTLQPCSRIGNNVTIWSNNLIGHHASIEDHCYVAGQVVVAGNTTIEPHCFIGVGVTIGHELRIGRESIIGAGSIVTKNVKPKSVYIASDTPKYRLDSAAFLKLSGL
jgi:sugar O-acyltransferase (sialic acid O-acetyltransferase NeuD family)